MHIHRALSDIAEIRRQLDRTASYHGFRSLAVALSVPVVCLGYVAEKAWVDQPSEQVVRYLIIWITVAVVSALIAGGEMIVRGIISKQRQVWKLHRALVTEIAPSLLVGLVMTLLIAGHAVDQPLNTNLLWSLPGVWAMCYAVGLFACRHHLPPLAAGVSGWFLIAGAVLLGRGWFTHELAGWQMVALFAVGQTLLSLTLHWNLERRSE